MALISCISALVFILGLTATCFSEIISLKPFKHDSTDVIAKGSKLPFGYRFLSPMAASPRTEEQDDLTLLDIVLLASVDGKFHALNRTSGQILWSMASSTSSSGLIPSTLGPLVRTSHVETDPDLTDDDSPDQELYIVEPQSGDIYVMSSPTSPLQRLSLSMSQLVQFSPFTFSRGDDRRNFVGKKETSLLVLELDTGRVKASLNTECPWNPFEDLHENTDKDIDLDDLESPNEKSTPTEIYIGRTDYHVKIYPHHYGSSPKPSIQDLSFSTYGANNHDSALQSAYHRTIDDVYIQSLPNGVIVCLKAVTADESDPSQASPFLWHHKFDDPIVAVFDVLKSPNRPQPFVLLQPRPRLQDVLPGRMDHLPYIDSAYVGLVKETGSLFAMSPDRFPLVIFSDADPSTSFNTPSSDPTTKGDQPPDNDVIATTKKPQESCRIGSPDRACLTGVRPLAEDSRSRFSRLLDGAPSVELPPGQTIQNHALVDNETTQPDSTSWNNFSVVPPWLWGPANSSLSGRNVPLGLDGSTNVFSAFGSLISALLLGLIWLAYKNPKSSRSERVALKQNGLHVSEPVQQLYVDPMSRTPKLPPVLLQKGTASSIEMVVAVGHPNTDDMPTKDPDDDPARIREDGNDWEESDKEGGDGATIPNKRKGRRGKRGKKKKVAVISEDDGENAVAKEKPVDGDTNPPQESPLEEVVPPPAQLVQSTSTPPADSPPAGLLLVVSETILGYGSHGTVVFQGSLQGRSVAVKRLLKDFVTLASREVSILQESDDHPNVIRYYYQEAHANFLYIALELCPASFADVVENPDQFREISITFDPKRALKQIASGLRHLHGLKLIHRDIKPQNILISTAKNGKGKLSSHRMLISDFGLCKKLDVDQTSFLPTSHGAMAGGTVGWRAPEILRGEVKLDDTIGDECSQSSRGSVGSRSRGDSLVGKPMRLTKSVDIFALGCLFYYTLTNGGHPFGDRFEREINILKDTKNLNGLERFGEEGSEATDLIESMLRADAQERPDTTTCLLHPFFWDSARRLTFLQDASDRFEIMCRDPRDPDLVTLETNAFAIVGNDWHSRLDKTFIENLGKFRKYDGRSVQDLLRALRNKKHHYQDLPDNVKRHLGPMPDGFLSYFTRRYPRLILHVHSVIANTALCQESMFRSYFELSDP